MTTSPLALQIQQLSFSWPQKSKSKPNTPTLIIDELTIKRQQHLFIKGPSGSGKSTLLNLLTGIISPQQGKIQILETDLTKLKNAERDQFRADHIGYIFQQFNLLPYLSVMDNVILPCQFSKQKEQRETGDLKEQAKHLLTRLGISEQLFNQAASNLSIGQQQRVAAARALIGQPEIIIADEPTSALDQDNRQAFIELLIEEADRTQATVIFVSHDATLEPYFTDTLALQDINQAMTQEQSA